MVNANIIPSNTINTGRMPPTQPPLFKHPILDLNFLLSPYSDSES